MKIAISKTLLEPIGIAWATIGNELLQDTVTEWDLEIAVNRYINAIEEHLQEGLPDIPVQDISKGIKQVIMNHGIKEVYAGYSRLTLINSERMYRFHISYRIPGEKKFRNIHASFIP